LANRDRFLHAFRSAQHAHEMRPNLPPNATVNEKYVIMRNRHISGFNGSLSSEQMWQVSLLLANADKLPATVRAAGASPPKSVTPGAEWRGKGLRMAGGGGI